MAIDAARLALIKEKIEVGARRNRKTPAFIAQILIHHNLIEISDGEEWLERAGDLLNDIGMPDSYLFQVKSILLTVQELRRNGYVIAKLKAKPTTV